MTDILQAFFTFTALFMGTLLCGYLPSCISAPPHVMNKIAIFGGGTIIGAALIVVLPEASSILINAQNKLDRMDDKQVDEVLSDKIQFLIGACVILGFGIMLFIDEFFKILKESQIKRAVEAANESMRAGE